MTERQQPLLDFIHTHYEARMDGPTTADVLRAFRFRNETSVVRGLEALAAAGHITRDHDQWKLRGPAVQLHFELPVAEARTPLR